MNELNITFTPQEFQILWTALGERPAKDVFPLMTKIVTQVQAQEQAAQRKEQLDADRPE